MKWRRAVIARRAAAGTIRSALNLAVETTRNVWVADDVRNRLITLVRQYGPHFTGVIDDQYASSPQALRMHPARYGLVRCHAIGQDYYVYDSFSRYFALTHVANVLDDYPYSQPYYDISTMLVFKVYEIPDSIKATLLYLPGPRPTLIGNYKAQVVRLREVFDIVFLASSRREGWYYDRYWRNYGQGMRVARLEKLADTIDVIGGLVKWDVDDRHYCGVRTTAGAVLATKDFPAEARRVDIKWSNAHEFGKYRFALVHWPVIGSPVYADITGRDGYKAKGMAVYGGDIAVFPVVARTGYLPLRVPLPYRRLITSPDSIHMPHDISFVAFRYRSGPACFLCVPRCAPKCLLPETAWKELDWPWEARHQFVAIAPEALRGGIEPRDVEDREVVEWPIWWV